MFSVVIATHESERALVPTLAALVPGATAGIVREVIVADAGSTDATREVADLAGCEFLSSTETLGVRLSAAARTARGTWLMFLTAGVVPEPSWIDELTLFTERAAGEPRAAVFSGPRSMFGALRTMLGRPRSEGLMLPKFLYDELGGHRPAADPQVDLLRRIGRRRIVMLRTAAPMTPIVDSVK